MPRLKSLLKLELIVKDVVLKWLLKCAANFPGPKNRKIQRAYIENTLTGHMIQQLLNISLMTPKKQMDLCAKCLIIELLCNDTTLCIDLTKSGTILIDELFTFYRTLLPCLPVGIIKLGFKCNIKAGIDQKYIKDVNSFFYRILGRMKNLRWVTLLEVGDTEIMRQLGLHCENLEYVDVSNSWRLHDCGVAHLIFENPRFFDDKPLRELIENEQSTTACTGKLRFLGLKGTEVTNKGIGICLKYLPKLTSFGGYVNQGSVIHMMELLQPIDNQKLFKLTQLWEEKITESQTMLLRSICPTLNLLSTGSCSLTSIHQLRSVTSLTLDCDFQDWSEELYGYLLSHGSLLKTLVLNDNVNCKIDIGWLMELTPSLVSLTAFVFYSNVGYPVTWNSLEFAKIIVDSSKCVFELLANTPQLQILELKFQQQPYCENYTCIDDELIIDITSYGGLNKAKNIKIQDCNLGLVSVETFLFFCPDLQILSNLSLWRNFTYDQYEELLIQCNQSNWSLKLFFYEEPT